MPELIAKKDASSITVTVTKEQTFTLPEIDEKIQLLTSILYQQDQEIQKIKAELDLWKNRKSQAEALGVIQDQVKAE